MAAAKRRLPPYAAIRPAFLSRDGRRAFACRPADVPRLTAAPRGARLKDGALTTLVALCTADGDFIVQLRNNGRMGFPGGGAHPGEAPWDAARREVAEEMGVRIPATAVPDAHVRLYCAQACGRRADEVYRHVVHVYVVNGPWTTREVVRAAADAPEFGRETRGVVWPPADNVWGKGGYRWSDRAPQRFGAAEWEFPSAQVWRDLVAGGARGGRGGGSRAPKKRRGPPHDNTPPPVTLATPSAPSPRNPPASLPAPRLVEHPVGAPSNPAAPTHVTSTPSSHV